MSEQPSYVNEIASTDEHVRESQRLRYQIFGEELGAELHGEGDLDVDKFDEHCDHLLIRATDTGKVIASTRLLSEENAKLAGSFYSATEFDLSNLEKIPGRQLEMGRTCVHPEYRNGTVINMLFNGISNYMVDEGFAQIFGCASVSWQTEGEGDGQQVYAIMRKVREKYLIEPEYRITPNISVPDIEEDVSVIPNLPPLLKAYLALGCKACGEAAWDADFQVADVPVLLRIPQMNPRWAKRFLGAEKAREVGLI